MTVTSTSSGRLRYSGSNPPRIQEGHSVRLTTVSSRAASSRQRAPGTARVTASRALRMRCSRSARLTRTFAPFNAVRSEEHTSELQSRQYLVCRLLLEKKKKKTRKHKTEQTQ